MATGANVWIVGNLVGPVKLNYTPAGTAVATFTVAYSADGTFDRVKGMLSIQPRYIECELWQAQGERAAQVFQEGDRVMIAGELRPPVVWVMEIAASIAYTNITVARGQLS